MVETRRQLNKINEMIKKQIKADLMCLTLNEAKEGEIIEQDPMHKKLIEIFNLNVEEMQEIEAKTPIRIESWREIKLQLNQLENGPMNINRVKSIYESDDKEEIENWTLSLIHSIQKFNYNFVSYQDIWSLASMGIVECILGVNFNLDQKGKIECSTQNLEFRDQIELLHQISSGNFNARNKVHQIINENLTPLESLDISRNLNEEDEHKIYVEDQNQQFLNQYKFTLKNLPEFENFDAILFDHHLKAFDLMENERKDLDASNLQISNLVPHLIKAKKFVNEKLFDLWPENPTLNDVIKSIDNVLDHPLNFNDKSLNFQLGLENLLKHLNDWNQRARSDIVIDSNLMKITSKNGGKIN